MGWKMSCIEIDEKTNPIIKIRLKNNFDLKPLKN
jgi:hypothetical protein